MPQTLEAKLTRKPKSKIQIEITKKNVESFCDGVGFTGPLSLRLLMLLSVTIVPVG